MTALQRHDDLCVNELAKKLVDAVRFEISNYKAALDEFFDKRIFVQDRTRDTRSASSEIDE